MVTHDFLHEKGSDFHGAIVYIMVLMVKKRQDLTSDLRCERLVYTWWCGWKGDALQEVGQRI